MLYFEVDIASHPVLIFLSVLLDASPFKNMAAVHRLRGWNRKVSALSTVGVWVGDCATWWRNDWTNLLRNWQGGSFLFHKETQRGVWTSNRTFQKKIGNSSYLIFDRLLLMFMFYTSAKHKYYTLSSCFADEEKSPLIE